MIKHYFKIGFRNLLKYKTQSSISILGLAIGLTFFTVGYYWYRYETSYDSFYPESEHIYNIYTIDKQTGKMLPGAPVILCAELNENFPEVKYAATLSNAGGIYTSDNKTIGTPLFKWVNQSYTRLFPPKVIAGNITDPIPTTEDGTKTNLMVTRRFALKYWKTPEEAIGKTLTDQNKFTQTITAVIENPPSNSIFQADGYYSIQVDKSHYTSRSPEYYWNYPPNEMYVCLHENTDVKAFSRKLRTYSIKNQLNPNLYIEITPITKTRYQLGAEMSFNLNYIRTFVISGLLLLFCSLFNFINLQVNRIFERSREFKLRTSLGAVKKNLFCQIIIEISIQVLLALLVGVSLTELTTPYIEQLLDTSIQKQELFIDLLQTGIFGWTLLSSIVLLIISRFIHKQSNDFKAGPQLFHTANNEWIRKISIGLQLGICVGFMFTAQILFLQINRMKNTAMGFDTDNLIQVNISSQIYSQFIDEIKQIPSITDCIRGGNFRLSHDNWHTEKEIGWENKPANASYEIQMIQAGIDFAQKMKITLKKGRYLEDTDMQSDDPSGIGCHKILINEQMAHLLGTTDPIGKMISRKDYILRGTDDTPPLYFEIVGVVKDFHGLSLRNPIPPTVIEYWNFYDYYLYLRTLPGKEKEALKAVKELISRITPEGFPLSETMTVNDQLEILTRTENASLRLFTLLAVLCALISIFGIYSISSSNMQQRKKEIAIRKVMGATSREIIDMFLKEYTIITLTANAIALPVGYLFVQKWLEQYPQSVHIQLWMFISILLVTILLVILTVLGQVVRAANGNPADVVKSD